MALALGSIFARQHKSAHICHDQGIHAGILQLLQISRQLHDLIIAGHGVYGHMNFHTVAMGKFHSLGHFLRGKVTGEGTHTKVSTCQVYGIRAIQNGHFQPLHITGRTQ